MNHFSLPLPESPGPLRGATKLGATRPETTPKKGLRSRKSKKPRMKHPDSSDSTVSNRKPRPPLQGLNQTSWSPSEASQSAFNVSYPAMVPAYPLYPPANTAPAQAPHSDPSLASAAFGDAQSVQVPPTAAAPFPAPIVTPVWALVLPNYVFSQIGQVGQLPAATRPPPFFVEQPQVQPTFAPQQPFQPPQPQFAVQTQPAFASAPPFNVQQTFAPQQPFQPTQTAFAPVPTQFVAQAPFPYGLATEAPKSGPREGAVSRSSTPASGAREPTTSPPLFESRCSSPLQLNLLSMEEGHRSVERQDSMVPSTVGQGNSGTPAGPAGAIGDKSRGSAKTENHQQVSH